MNQSNLLTVRVAGVMNRQAVVLHAGRTLPCLLSGRLLRQKDSLAVGDRAEAEVLGGGQYRLTRILPRTSALRRPSRRGSGTWRYRLSKMFSTKTVVPRAVAAAAIITDCISVGKPG